MSNVIMNKAYTPAEAERGKFAVVDTASVGLTGSYGRYAVLTHNIGTVDVGTSSDPISAIISNTESIPVSVTNWNAAISANFTLIEPVSTIISNTESIPVSVTNWNAAISANFTLDEPVCARITNIDEITSAFTFDISAYITNVGDVSAYITNDSIAVKLTTDPVSLWIGSSSFPVSGVLNKSFDPKLVELEIQNKTDSTVYFIPTTITDPDDIVSKGLEISSDGYYTASRNMTDITIMSLASGNVKILGYY